MNSNCDIPSLALPRIAALEPYTPGLQPSTDHWIKLNTNEFPYPPAPGVAEAITAEIPKLALYPNPTAANLRAAIARHHGLDPAQVIVGNGSDDILNLLMRTFAEGETRPSAMLRPGYSLYPVLSAIQGAPCHPTAFDPLVGDANLDPACFAQHPAPILFLTAPNAPFGTFLSPPAIEAASTVFKGIFVVDEAYAAFAPANALPLLARNPRLVITRTFSKSHGLAGLRVGYALAHPDLINLLDRVRDSYNVNRLSQAGALAALNAVDYYHEHAQRIIQTRENTATALRSRGFTVLPSSANFLFCIPPASNSLEAPTVAENLYHFLCEHRILVRHLRSHPLTAQGLRISIGTDSQMLQLIETIDAWTPTQINEPQR